MPVEKYAQQTKKMLLHIQVIGPSIPECANFKNKAKIIGQKLQEILL